MKTLRFNIFNKIHKGLRVLLYNTAISIQHTAFLQPDQAREAFDKVEKTLWMFDSHAHTEDELLFPLLQTFAPDIVMDFEQQHQRDHELAESLRLIIHSYAFATDAAAKLKCGVLLQQAFDEFTAFNLQHMNREETIINEALWQHYADQDIAAIEKTIVASLTPEQSEFSANWMMRGLNNAEIADWLKKVQAGAPEMVFNGLCAVAARELPIERWITIRESMDERSATIY
jgi:hypothetical protein